jgi:DNA replication protein DnaC
MNNFTPCNKCAGSRHPGYIEINVRGFKGSGAHKLIECECHKEWARGIAGKRHLDKSGLPNFGFDISGYAGVNSLVEINALKRYVMKWPENEDVKRAWLYIYGENGTQKTITMDWVGRQLCPWGTVKYLTAGMLERQLREAFTEDDKRRAVNELKEYDILILDEMFDVKKTNVTDWFIPMLDNFLRERVESSKKGLITISNVAPFNISEKFGTSLKNLVNRNVRNTTLHFKDDYWKTIEGDIEVVYNPGGLFA